MRNGGLAQGDVRVESAEVPNTRHSGVPDVRIAGVAVEIRGDGAQVVRGALEEWLENQQRRMEYLRYRSDAESQRTLRKIAGRVEMVNRVLQAWEGVLAVPIPDEDIQ